MSAIGRSLPPVHLNRTSPPAQAPASKSSRQVADAPNDLPRAVAGEGVRRNALMAALAKSGPAGSALRTAARFVAGASPIGRIATAALFVAPHLKPALTKLVSPGQVIGHGGLTMAEEMQHFAGIARPGFQEAAAAGMNTLAATAKAVGVSVGQLVDFSATALARPSSPLHELASGLLESGVISDAQKVGFDSTIGEERRRFSLNVGF